MPVTQIVVFGGSGLLNGDTAATPSTAVVRDSSSGIAGAQISASELKTNGILTLKRSATKTTGFTLDATATVWPCDATGGAFAATLPPAVSTAERIYCLKKIDASANAITVTGAGGDLIDGAATKTLPTQWKSIIISSDGVSAWHILAVL